MVEPEKPFACAIQGCGMTFTNEDHLHVHTKKHDMVLQFGMEQKAAFVADQTPTPTRFIRNCEEVGLFQDLQNVNPFDEGFKRAMESKLGIQEGVITTPSSTDDLHTPQMFPLMDSGDSVFTTNQRNITISRSSSDESGAIKEFETTTISKLTNEVTTISRIVEKHEDVPKNDEPKKDSIRKDSVSYRNNVIKILSNVEIRNEKPITSEDLVKKEAMKDYQLQVPPIMSQQSIDNVVESLTSDFNSETKKEESVNDYEVILKLPSGQQIKLTSAEVDEKLKNTKDLLKKVLTNKVEMKNNFGAVVMPSVIPITTGTLIPVSLVNGMSIVNNAVLPKLPIKVLDKRPVKRKNVEISLKNCHTQECKEKIEKESRKAASKRYRVKDKEAKQKLALENNQLRRLNEKLQQEKTTLKVMIMEHMSKCPNCDDFKNYLSNTS